MAFQSKKQYFTFLSARDQSDVTKRLSLLARAHGDQAAADLVADWIEAERELIAGACSFRPWLEPYLDDEEFQKEATRFLDFELKQCQFQQRQKERQQTYRAKEPATPKQVKYLKNLLRKRNETPAGPLDQLTKGEASEWIERLAGVALPENSD